MNETLLKVTSNSEEETLQLGEEIGKLVEPGQIILLSGNLGAGKTVMAQGIANGLGVEEDITSPTFNLINEYEGELTLFHMDLYRLESEEDVFDLGFEDYLERDGVVVIEWPDLAYDLLPPDFLYINIEDSDESKRVIYLEAEGEGAEILLERLEKNVSSWD